MTTRLSMLSISYQSLKPIFMKNVPIKQTIDIAQFMKTTLLIIARF